MTTRTKESASKKSFADYIAHQVDMSDKTQKEMALRLGYDNPNIISMFKKGLTKVPIPKVPIFADILGIDRVHLLRLAMLEYAPDLWETFQSVIGKTVTSNELEIIEIVRSVVGDDDPALNAEARRLFKTAAKALK